jgi:hypothetical protein
MAAVDCGRTQAKPKKIMAARSAAIIFLGFTLGNSYKIKKWVGIVVFLFSPIAIFWGYILNYGNLYLDRGNLNIGFLKWFV